MRTYFLHIAVYMVLFFLSACNQPKQPNESSTDHATPVETAPFLPTNGTVSKPLTELGLTASTDWRGINLGDPFRQVNATEKGESFERDAEHVGYTIGLKNLQTMDVLYYQTGGNISAIDVDLFLNSRQAVTAYQAELTTYFTNRYGAPKTGDGLTWAGKKGTTVSLKDVSKGKDYGLTIKLAQPVAQ